MKTFSQFLEISEELKGFKSPEKIAKKHDVSLDSILQQLKIGIKIEKEHTENKDIAKRIALQHIDEIPDYYNRLTKMEKGVKTDVISELESGLKKLKNISYDSIDTLMRRIMKKYNMTAKQLHNAFVNKHSKTPDDWIKNLKEENKSGDEGLHDWFNKSKSSDDKKGWVQLGGKWAGRPCARQPGQTSTPKCGSSKMAANLSPGEEEEARRRKNRLDPNQPEKTGGAKPTNVRTESINLQEVKDKPGKGSGKKDACYHKVKARYNVWPSAYASGALVKCRKVGAANWGTQKEDYTFIQKRGTTYTILLTWKGKMLTLQMFFPQFKRPSRDEVLMQIQKIYPGANLLSFAPSIKDPTKPLLFSGDCK